MRFISAFIACCLFALMPAPSAATPAKNAEVPFREDAGLITAEYYLATGKYTQALDVLGGVLQRHHRSADAYAYRGYAYQQLGEIKKAQENYARSLEINPAHLGAHRYLAGLYVAAGETARALEQLQAMRLVCGAAGCAEIDELQGEINQAKRAQRDTQTP